MNIKNHLNKLFGKNEFDGEVCIRLLNDQTLPPGERLAAAESLAFYPKQSACNSLFKIIMDENEDDTLREEAATSLGAIWEDLGIEQDKLSKIPENLQFEILASIPKNKVKYK